MDNQQAYNVWADNYDTVQNKTRDLEATALRKSVSGSALDILELGCGTGKNTEWLLTKARHLVCADFSTEMLEKARDNISAENVEFRQFDLRDEWKLAERQFDLITSSLVLEHVEKIDFVFEQARQVLRTGGLFYLGELHPFKQYQGSKARFDTAAGVFELECFVHHISDFFAAAQNNGFDLVDLKEWFDDDTISTPRILTMIFRKTI